MSEIRYDTVYDYPKDISASEKTVANAIANGWIKYESFEVSDEELQAEADERTIGELSAPDRILKSSETAKLIQAMARQRR